MSLVACITRRAPALFSHTVRQSPVTTPRHLSTLTAGLPFAEAVRLPSCHGKTKAILQPSARATLHLTQERDERKDRALVLLFPWVGASKESMAKFTSLYAAQGLDVLVVNGSPLGTEFLWPKKAAKLGDRVSKWLERNDQYNEYFVHAFSNGNFTYTQLVMNLAKKQKHFSLLDRIKGEVFDSMACPPFDRVAHGVAINATETRLAQKVVENMISSYLQFTKGYTFDFYSRSFDNLREFPTRCPSLFYNSRNDPLSDPYFLKQKVMKPFIESKKEVESVCWDNSMHASHFSLHHDQYLAALLPFVKSALS